MGRRPSFMMAFLRTQPSMTQQRTGGGGNGESNPLNECVDLLIRLKQTKTKSRVNRIEVPYMSTVLLINKNQYSILKCNHNSL